MTNLSAKEPEQSHLAEALGVKEGEVWDCPDLLGSRGPYRIHNGMREVYVHETHKWEIAESEYDLTVIINNPGMIVHTVRLTKPERAICSAVGASWISKSADEAWVRLWNKRPELEEDGLHYTKDVELLALVGAVFFPSISTGDCFYIGGYDQEGGAI